MCTDPRGIYIQGWARNAQGRWLQPESLASGILCGAHNAALSPLDEFALLFVDELDRTTEAVANGNRVATVMRFHGDNLERWMLKAACGLVASKQSAKADGQPILADVPPWWVECLFGRSDLVRPLGLFVRGTVGHREDIGPQFSIAPIGMGEHVVGLQFSYQWFRAILMMIDWSGSPGAGIDHESVRRPSVMSLVGVKSECRLEFTWSHSPGEGVQLAYGAGAV